MQLLMPRGTLYFSTNFKKFKMSEEITRQFFVRDITNETIDYDFQRKPKMHRVCAIKNR